ncbi:MAG: LacI family DNA-binding transcriptional regulator [Phycisphaerales bacterium]|nr:LacI family DNA-binding transcriptional regulator [Phycisphaerales bacterium]
MDIAKMAGVGLATVSRVINNSDLVSPETRKRVTDIMRATHYRPSQAAYTLPKRRHDTIGLITQTDTWGSYVPELIRGVTEALTDSGLRLAMGSISSCRPAGTLEKLPLFRSWSVDGAILDTCNLLGDVDGVLRRLRTPVVFVNAPAPRPFNTVMPDDNRAARQAVEYLIQRGHRKIGYLPGGTGTHSSIAMRKEAYMQAMRAHSLQPLPLWDKQVEYVCDEYVERLKILTAHGMTAAVTYCGLCGAMTLRSALKLNIKVPDQLSIVCCDSDVILEHAAVPLTSFKQDRFEMGRLAVQMLVERIEHQSRDIPSVYPVGKLVELESVRSI